MCEMLVFSFFVRFLACMLIGFIIRSVKMTANTWRYVRVVLRSIKYS